MKQIKRWGLLFILIGLLGLVLYFHLYRDLTYDNLSMHRINLLLWTHQHFVQAVLGFMVVYTLAVAISIPGATFLTLVAGFLFGPLVGSVAVVMSATVGAFIIFTAISLALREWVIKKGVKWTRAMEKGFQENAFSYLLFLRLVPLFPFWLVNIIPALLGVPKHTFVFATFLGIIPGVFVYVMVGHGLGHLLDINQTPDLDIFLDPKVLVPLLGLAIFSLVPVGYRYMKRKKHN